MNKELLYSYSLWFQNYFLDHGMHPDLAAVLNAVINFILITAVIYIIDLIVKKLIISAFRIFSNKTKTTFDDFLVVSNFPKFIAHIIPLLIAWSATPIVFREFSWVSKILLIGIKLTLIVLGVYVARSVLRTIKNYLHGKEKYKDKPLQSYLQVLMIFAWGIGIFMALSLLTGYSAISVASLGAVSAMILLIFKDTILGFVASIQISVNDNVRIGDWITFSKYGADGAVIEISLATVSVQNFDNTITTIPTFSLTSDSFQNWRGMQESGGRRIKRAIYIKQNSIKFLSIKEIEELKQIELIQPYLEHKRFQINKFNHSNEINDSLSINGKNQTNIGVFRAYIDAYLKENPAINKDMYMMVRHLAPTDKGIPLQILCFSYDKAWENYEAIQADLFDHLLAAVSYFHLEVFESPSGKDFDFKA